MGIGPVTERRVSMGSPVKRERFERQLDAITAQAIDRADLETMRDALAEVQRKVNGRLFELKKAEFKLKSGGNTNGTY